MKKQIRYTLILLASFMMVFLSACGGSSVSKTYEKAQEALVNGNYENAAELFESINSYEDSSKLALYSKALLYGEQENYDKAIETLVFLGDFKDSAQLKYFYEICKLSVNENPIVKLSAAEQFDSIAMYRDSSNRAEECRQAVYSEANNFFTLGEYDAAHLLFSELGSYKDSPEQLVACDKAKEEKENAAKYTEAEVLLAKEDFDGAIKLFRELGDYRDSAERIEEIANVKKEKIYTIAEELLAKADYEGAVKEYGTILGYKDVEDKLWECCEQLYFADRDYDSYYYALLMYAKIDDEDGVMRVLDQFREETGIGNILECMVFPTYGTYKYEFFLIYEKEEGYRGDLCSGHVVGYLGGGFEDLSGQYDPHKEYHPFMEAYAETYRQEAAYVFDYR